VLLQTQVFFTALFGFVLLKERASRPLQVGMGLAVLGLSCFAINYLLPGAGAGTTLAGFALTLCAAAMWAASNIVARRVQQGGTDYSPTAFVVWSSSVAVLPFVLLSLVFDADAVRWQWLDARLTSWLAVAYLGWVATLVGYSLWTGLLKRHPANRVAPFSLGVPIVGLAAGVGVLGEHITPWQWGGIALVVCALVCVTLGGRLQQRKQPGS
jgi:O-acetylserine/cysteine efflux transporter